MFSTRFQNKFLNTRFIPSYLGGIEAERETRAQIVVEEEERRVKQTREFDDMIKSARRERGEPEDEYSHVQLSESDEEAEEEHEEADWVGSPTVHDVSRLMKKRQQKIAKGENAQENTQGKGEKTVSSLLEVEDVKKHTSSSSSKQSGSSKKGKMLIEEVDDEEETKPTVSAFVSRIEVVEEVKTDADMPSQQNTDADVQTVSTVMRETLSISSTDGSTTTTHTQVSQETVCGSGRKKVLIEVMEEEDFDALD